MIAQTTTTMMKPKQIWKDNNISHNSRVKLMRFLVISIFLCVCVSWSLTAETQKKLQAF